MLIRASLRHYTHARFWTVLTRPQGLAVPANLLGRGREKYNENTRTITERVRTSREGGRSFSKTVCAKTEHFWKGWTLVGEKVASFPGWNKPRDSSTFVVLEIEPRQKHRSQIQD